MSHTEISTGQEARRLAKETGSTWQDSRRTNGSDTLGLCCTRKLSPPPSWAHQLQHLCFPTSSHSRGSGLPRDLTPEPQHSCRARAACSPARSLDLRCLQATMWLLRIFSWMILIFAYTRGKASNSLQTENYWSWNTGLEWLQKAWLSEYDELLLHTGIY